MTFKRLLQLLKEDAIDNFELHGNWNNDAPKHGYDKASTNILTNPVAVQKIKKKWEKTDQTFDLYFVRSKDANKLSEYGRVPPEFVRDVLKINVPINPESITIFYVNNRGDEKMPMTAWTLAHRFGHAMNRRNFQMPFGKRDIYGFNEFKKYIDEGVKEIAQEVYGRKLNILDDQNIANKIAQAVGTFKSARDNNIRNYNEFYYELLAQYIVQGKITLNKTLPKILPMRSAWGKPSGYNRILNDESEIEDILWTFQNTLNYAADNALGNVIGSIFVM